ncbi:MAG: CPBP family intramembrane glutamic endopeptidase [Candidatus Roizmanbacteria bacterium]
MKEKVTPTQKALNLWAIILIVWAFYRSYIKMPEWFDEFIAKPIIFVLPVFYYIKKIDKRSVFNYLNLKLKGKEIFYDLLYSLGIGLIFLVTAVSASYFRTGKLIFVGKLPNTTQFLTILAISLATGITEEILSRGFVLRKLYEESKNVLSSTFFASLLFFFLHVPILFTNIKITGNMLLMFMATDMLLSMVNGLIFLQKRSLTIPIFIHAFYNIIIGLTFI